MLYDLVEFPIQHPRLQWAAKQVVRDLHGMPYLFVRLHLTGAHFQQRALEPFVRVGRLRSLFVKIAADELSADAYFDQPPAEDGVVVFGYGQDDLLHFDRRFGTTDVRKLDRRRLPAGIRNVERFFGTDQSRRVRGKKA